MLTQAQCDFSRFDSKVPHFTVVARTPGWSRCASSSLALRRSCGGAPTNMSLRPTEMGLPSPVWRSILNATRNAHPLGVVIVSNDASRKQTVEIGLANPNPFLYLNK